MVVKELLELASSKLEHLAYVDGNKEALLIYGKLIDRDISSIYSNLYQEVDQDLEKKFLDIVDLRSKGMPFHYIFREKDFFDLNLYIEEGVLIPRYETEILVEEVIDYIRSNYRLEDQIDILEIGVGSGAISLALAKACPNSRILGLDINRKAIRVADINKDRLALENVDFIYSDLFESIENLDRKFDIIISNPPYIKIDELDGLQRDVIDYEPINALDGGPDGLDFYRAISSQAKKYFKPGGIIVYEIGYNQAKEVRHILEVNNFSDIDVLPDLQGHDRIVRGKHSKE